MIKQNQQARGQQMESLFDNLAAKYGGGGKPRATKRKAAMKGETAPKIKKRK